MVQNVSSSKNINNDKFKIQGVWVTLGARRTPSQSFIYSFTFEKFGKKYITPSRAKTKTFLLAVTSCGRLILEARLGHIYGPQKCKQSIDHPFLLTTHTHKNYNDNTTHIL